MGRRALSSAAGERGRRLGGSLAGKVVVDCTNPISWKDGPVWAPPPEGANKTVSAIATQAGSQPIDAGPLRNASVLENVAILWIHLASVGGLGRDFVLQLTKR